MSKLFKFRIKGTSINSGRVAKRIKQIECKAKIAENSLSICKVFNEEVGFFKRLGAVHELLEVPSSHTFAR